MSSLYEAPAEPPGLEAAPSVEDFTKAFQALGLALADTPRREQREDLPDTALNGSKKPAVLKGTLYHLQLLLRTLAAVCRYQKQVPASPPVPAACAQALPSISKHLCLSHHCLGSKSEAGSTSIGLLAPDSGPPS